MTWPAVVIWILAVACFFSKGPGLFYLFALSGAVGTLQMLPGESLAGINLLPQPLVAVFVIIKVLLARDNAIRAISNAVNIRKSGFFTLYVLYSLSSAFILPRVFNGQIDVIPISGDLDGVSVLHPSSGNYTQSAYLILTYLVVICFSVVGDNAEMREKFKNALVAFGLFVVATGLVDLICYTFGASAILEPFRNATYALLTDVEAVGNKRVVGLMSEASSYGATCISILSLLVMLRPCYSERMRSLYIPVVILLLVVMTCLSTSTGAYAGFGVLAVCFVANWAMKSLNDNMIGYRGLTHEAYAMVAVAFTILFLFVAFPGVIDSFQALFSAMVLEKPNSLSYLQRSLWTHTAWQAFLDTNYIGVGYGSVRTSNWFVAVLASTGIVGGLLIAAFFVAVFSIRTARSSSTDREFSKALRFALLPTFVMWYFGGTIPDIGVWVGALLGILQFPGEPLRSLAQGIDSEAFVQPSTAISEF